MVMADAEDADDAGDAEEATDAEATAEADHLPIPQTGINTLTICGGAKHQRQNQVHFRDPAE